jgi:dTDP-4-dehydrorhamnose 3,5-epimerase
MQFQRTDLEGVLLVDTDISADQRGSFARAFCDREFGAAGLNTSWPQHNVSRNAKRGVLRGLHYQAAPHEEIKLIRCIGGRIFDVLVDIRRSSATFGRWIRYELTADNGRALYVPAGIAHGFQALEDDSTLYYLMSTHYAPQSARGLAWNDPELAIDWPVESPIVSAADQTHPSLRALLGSAA